MAVGFSNTNKPLNPRGQDASPKGYNRASLYSGKALDFDGVNDYVDGGTLDITDYTQMSVSFYMNIDTTTQDFRLISIRYSGADDIRIFHSVSIGAGVLNFSLDDGDVDNIGVNFETNEWYHVVMTHDGTTLKAYFNGIEQASTASTFDYANANGLFYIGRYTGGAVTFYDGEASNVKIFNTALTAAQVADLYNNPEKVVPTGVDNTALKLWLPMMEGAGTTAYDGSGNGNHGTISGATYVHGIGAPVAQTAVISWNKNKNSITNSTDFSAAAGWNILTSGGGTAAVANGYAESPYGGQTAARLQASKGTNYALVSFTPAVSTSGTYVSSIWAKSNTGSTQSVAMSSRNSVTGKKDVTTEWTRIEFTGSGSSNYFSIGSLGTADASIDILIWGAQMVLDATEAGPYIPTIGTAQTSEVLLPQGLTTGRDITGVNLFENVRKQGALNLDGNSWAEVHDNESLDITDAITLEAWVYADEFADMNGAGIIAKWDEFSKQSYLFYTLDYNTYYFFISSTGSNNDNVTFSLDSADENKYNHLVCIYDGSNITMYKNGNVAVTKTTALSSLYVSDKVLEIGRYDLSTTRTIETNIAQPRIYNRALTAEEVLQNYNSGKNTYK